MVGTPKMGDNLKSVSRFLGTLLVLSVLTGLFGLRVTAQNLPVPNSNIAEEQDYAFARGLFKDGLFQLAVEQFENFVKKYPQAVQVQDAKFLRADCHFQLAQYPTAVKEFTEFVNEYPVSILSDNARFRLGDSYSKLNRNLDAIASYKSILDHPLNPAVAGEAAYWIGEIYFKEADFNNALKYYTLSYEGYPGNRLQDYAAFSAAWTNQTKGDFAKAAEWYRVIINKFPKSTLISSARIKVGECSYYGKDFPRAIEELTAAKASIDSVALRGEADYLIGESYFNLGQYAQAEKQYELFITDTRNIGCSAKWNMPWDGRSSRRNNSFQVPKCSESSPLPKGSLEKLHNTEKGWPRSWLGIRTPLLKRTERSTCGILKEDMLTTPCMMQAQFCSGRKRRTRRSSTSGRLLPSSIAATFLQTLP